MTCMLEAAGLRPPYHAPTHLLQMASMVLT